MPARQLLVVIAFVLCSCSSPVPDAFIEQGVSWDLAEHRAQTISNVEYDIHLTIPDAVTEPIAGRISIAFDLAENGGPVVIDFNQPPDRIQGVFDDQESIEYNVANNHIVIHGLEAGRQDIRVDFWAGEGSLNRTEEYLYTLFVPDRASFALPLFDQPNLKARYILTLDTPSSWKAVSNGPLLSETLEDNRLVHAFDQTKPISTYLFSFAAGIFESETVTRNGRQMTMYHRETDTTKVARNRDAIFDLHIQALEWLETYTAIDYPFEKFDFALIPSFQYGGMEHPGAILYRQSSLMLDESATQNQYLGRASLIAHETAHMWFGDLVTMNWFDDVWTKEVFANFMAAKITNPAFPEINHDLRFLLRHYPAAYEVDRTNGANPIRQPLENLQMAGTLYGAIIYQKAPIVMKHLEQLVGEDLFRQGLQTYLDRYQYANATWLDLIDILDDLSEEDLKTWSQVWVEEPGRPQIETRLVTTREESIDRLELVQSDPFNRGRTWTQRLQLRLFYPDSSMVIPVTQSGPMTTIAEAAGLPRPLFILPNGDGVGYGHFVLDPVSLQYLSTSLGEIADPLHRGIAWTSLWSAVLDQNLKPRPFFDLAVQSLQTEKDELNTQRILNYLSTTYWRFLKPAERASIAPDLEALLWGYIESSESTSLKSAFFNTYKSILLTKQGFRNLYAVWHTSRPLQGLKFSERDYTAMALDLALRDTTHGSDILKRHISRIKNQDRKARFTFVMPALSSDPEERDAFFTSLHDDENRLHEPWVLEALRYLHHPLRAASSEKYIRPSLDLLDDIQRTGDIFFPKRWLDVTFSGYQSPASADAIRAFLDENPNYPYRLRNKILQSADILFRAAEITR